MDNFDVSKLFEPFGLRNIGAICYMNSLIQAMISCTSFTKAVLANKEYLHKTELGQALFEFVSDILSTDADAEPKTDISAHSSKIVTALLHELQKRQPKIKYANGQECASEGLSLVLMMLEDPEVSIDKIATNPISKLFTSQYSKIIECTKCEHRVNTVEYKTQHLIYEVKVQKDVPDRIFFPISNSKLEGYKCDKCESIDTCEETIRISRISEIIVVTNMMLIGYRSGTGQSPIMDTPSGFGIPNGDKVITFGKVAQIEQMGSQHSGHYTAAGARKGRIPYLFDDQRVGRLRGLGPTPNTFMTFYHTYSAAAESASLRET